MALFSVLSRTTDGLLCVCFFIYTITCGVDCILFIAFCTHCTFVLVSNNVYIAINGRIYIVSRASSNYPISHWVELVKSIYTTSSQVNRHIYTNQLIWKYSLAWQINGRSLLHQTSAHCLLVWCNITQCSFGWLGSP